MALSGLEIYKLLPKTNCKECGPPTCLAFAMQLAQKKAELSACPYASDEAKSILGAASEPPMRTLKCGTGPYAFEIGGETEMFRHEKTFYHQTAVFIKIEDTGSPDSIAAEVTKIDNYIVERVGEQLSVEGICLTNSSGDKDKYLTALDAVMENSSRAIMIDSGDADVISAALEKLNGRRPIVYPNKLDPLTIAPVCSEKGANLVVSADSFDTLEGLTHKISGSDYKNLILNITGEHTADIMRKNSLLRRSALRKNFKPFGYPALTYLTGNSEAELLADAVTAICKYSSVVVLPGYSPEILMTLFTLRQNIYTDPQKPIQVDPKIAPIGEPDKDSPVFVTTNFSLTYFIISGEIENAGISAWLIIPDCEGMSVLTAWAAGKFSGEKIAKFALEAGIESKVDTRDIIIPGYVATISGDLEEALPGWNVVVGPQEASDLAPFLKNYFNV